MRVGLLSCACALALALGLAACGDNQETRAVSGTRLRLSWLEYEDGTRQLVDGQLWDETRGETCLPQLWSDGNVYCAPTDRAGLYPYYTDAACSRAEYLAEVAGEPDYVARFADGEGESVQMLLARPEATTLAQYWVREGDDCLGPYSGESSTFYRAGSEVPRSDLVRVRVSETTGNGRVGVRASTSEDGLYAPLDFVDRRLHAPCSLTPFTADTASCVPVWAGEVRYLDAVCAKPVFGTATSDEDPPPAIVAGSTCDPRVFAVAGAAADPAGFERSGDGCVASSSAASVWFTLVEHPVALVPRAREEVAGRRLQPIVLEIDGVRVVTRQLFDTDVGEECTRATSPREADVYRCVPRDVGYVVDAFADAVCTIPIEVGLVYTGVNRAVCTSTDAPRYARDFSGATIIRSLGAPRAAPIYFRLDGNCRIDQSTAYRVHELGDPIADDRWARASLVRD